MTDTLKQTFDTRAARAVDGPDLDEILGLVGERRTHRRRTTLAAGVTSLAVAGLVVTGSVVLSDQGASRPVRSATQQALAGGPVNGLLAAPPAPAGAETSLGLLPDGWNLDGFDQVATTYVGPDVPTLDAGSARPTTVRPASGGGASGSAEFVGKILSMPTERYDDAAGYLLTIAGRPGRMFHDASGMATMVEILVPDRDGKHLNVTIQIPDSAGLSEDQVLAIANSIDIRSTEHYAVG